MVYVLLINFWCVEVLNFFFFLFFVFFVLFCFFLPGKKGNVIWFCNYSNLNFLWLVPWHFASVFRFQFGFLLSSLLILKCQKKERKKNELIERFFLIVKRNANWTNSCHLWCSALSICLCSPPDKYPKAEWFSHRIFWNGFLLFWLFPAWLALLPPRRLGRIQWNFNHLFDPRRINESNPHRISLQRSNRDDRSAQEQIAGARVSGFYPISHPWLP